MSGEGVFFCVKFWAECVTLTPLSIDNMTVSCDSSAVCHRTGVASLVT